MTKYYQSIFKRMKPMTYMHFRTDRPEFTNAVLEKRFDVMSLNNKVFNFDKVPTHYKGSHFIRDPRDLCVSGMNYHRKTDEAWVHVEHGPQKYKNILKPAMKMDLKPVIPEEKVTIQKYLQGINDNEALLFEICWRDHAGHFEAMQEWDYENKNILEFKYEEIFGNELDCFRQLFEHYGLPPSLFKKGMKLAERQSFKKVSEKNQTIHTNKGTSGQWEGHFKNKHVKLFSELFPGLLEKTGYDSF